MFALNEVKTGLQDDRDQIVSVLLSINAPRISAADRAAEPTRSFICTLESGDKFQTHIVLYLVDSKQRVIYSWEKPYAKSKREEVEEEALDFVENMGFMMDNMNLPKLSKAQKEELLMELPIFEGSEAISEIEPEEFLDELESLADVSDAKTAVVPERVTPAAPPAMGTAKFEVSDSLDLLDEEFHRDAGDIDLALDSVFEAIAPDRREFVAPVAPVAEVRPPVAKIVDLLSQPPGHVSPRKPMTSLQAVVRLLASL